MSSISITLTNAAIITINDAILILLGMNFLTRDITRFENTNTNVAESPMPIALISDVVTARVGHIPSS